MSDGIHIKKKNRGKFTATKKRTGKSTEELTHSKNPLTRKRAIFAQNVRRWNHKKSKNESYMRKNLIRLTEGNLRRIVAEATMKVLAEAANPQYRAQIAQTGRTQNSMTDEYNQAKNDMFSDYYNFQNQTKQDYNQSQNQMKQGYNQDGQQANQNDSYERWNERNQKILKLREMGVIKNDNDEYLMRKKYNVPPTYNTNPHETW